MKRDVEVRPKPAEEEEANPTKEQESQAASPKKAIADSSGKSNEVQNPTPSSRAEDNAKNVVEKKPQEPQTYEGKVRYKVEKIFLEPNKEIKAIKAPQRPGSSCHDVTVEFYEEDVELMEYTMEDTYEAIYADGQLAGATCSVTTNAYGTLVNKYGQSWKKMIYSTAMDQTTASKVKWKGEYAVTLSSVWRVKYMHPTVRQEKARLRVEKAVDCAEDKGIFDVDTYCP